MGKTSSLLPQNLATDCIFAPSCGASGGLLIAWNPALLECTGTQRSEHSVTASLAARSANLRLQVTNVYGKCAPADRQAFIAKIKMEATHLDASIPWVLLGDFNLIRDPSERSNNNFDHAPVGDFNDFIRHLALQDLPLPDRLYTWSNRKCIPILAKVDRFLMNNAFGTALPNSSASRWDSSASDHVPILLTATTKIPRPTTFHFNNHWILYSSFCTLVHHDWASVAIFRPNLSIVQCLMLCLKRTRADLKSWVKQL